MTSSSDIRLTLGARAEIFRWWLSGGVLGPSWRFAAAISVTAGPWLIALSALWIITNWLQPVLGTSAVENLNLSVTYAFCLASLVAGPIGVIAARIIRTRVEQDQGYLVFELFVVAALGAGLMTELLAICLGFVLGLQPFDLAIAHVSLSAAAAMLWVSFSVLGALRAYVTIMSTFLAGMGFTVGCAFLAGLFASSADLAIWSFAIGTFLSVALTLGYLSRKFGKQLNELGAAMALLKKQAWVMRHLGLAVLLAVLAVWADKWFFWFGPTGERSTAGFLHYSVYDEVMFLAHLSIIPTFAGMFLLNDTEIELAIENFRQKIRNHATFATITESVTALCSVVWSGIFRIVFVQTSMTIIVVTLLLIASGSSTFEIERFVLLLITMTAVLFQSIGYLACTVLILASRTRMLLVVQFLFLMMNICGSILFYSIFGPSALAVFTSSLFFAVLAVIVGYKSLASYGYFVFLGENDSLYTRK